LLANSGVAGEQLRLTRKLVKGQFGEGNVSKGYPLKDYRGDWPWVRLT